MQHARNYRGSSSRRRDSEGRFTEERDRNYYGNNLRDNYSDRHQPFHDEFDDRPENLHSRYNERFEDDEDEYESRYNDNNRYTDQDNFYDDYEDSYGDSERGSYYPTSEWGRNSGNGRSYAAQDDDDSYSYYRGEGDPEYSSQRSSRRYNTSDSAGRNSERSDWNRNSNRSERSGRGRNERNERSSVSNYPRSHRNTFERGMDSDTHARNEYNTGRERANTYSQSTYGGARNDRSRRNSRIYETNRPGSFGRSRATRNPGVRRYTRG